MHHHRFGLLPRDFDELADGPWIIGAEMFNVLALFLRTSLASMSGVLLLRKFKNVEYRPPSDSLTFALFDAVPTELDDEVGPMLDSIDTTDNLFGVACLFLNASYRANASSRRAS
jgi:hypothetical protein